VCSHVFDDILIYSDLCLHICFFRLASSDLRLQICFSRFASSYLRLQICVFSFVSPDLRLQICFFNFVCSESSELVHVMLVWWDLSGLSVDIGFFRFMFTSSSFISLFIFVWWYSFLQNPFLQIVSSHLFLHICLFGIISMLLQSRLLSFVLLHSYLFRFMFSDRLFIFVWWDPFLYICFFIYVSFRFLSLHIHLFRFVSWDRSFVQICLMVCFFMFIYSD
jgi:hypothetical protein